MVLICSIDGAGTLIAKQRDLIAGITCEIEFAHKINRQVAIYFSIVRLRAC